VQEVTRDRERVMRQIDSTLSLRTVYLATLLTVDDYVCKIAANPQRVPASVVAVMRSHVQNFVDAYGEYLVERDKVLASRR
jgi:hypothetical protein